MNSLSPEYQHYTTYCSLKDMSKIGFEVYFAIKMLLLFGNDSTILASLRNAEINVYISERVYDGH